jgi:hypothetical protein
MGQEKRKGKTTMTTQTQTTVPFAMYRRPIDDGQGYQQVLVEHGIIVQQTLHSLHRGAWYTGDGNPDLIGKPVKALRGMGFRKVRLSADRLVQEYLTFLQQQEEVRELETVNTRFPQED